MSILDYFLPKKKVSPIQVAYQSIEQIVLPNDEGVVCIETHGEHHMGCSFVVISLPYPLEGCSRFVTTNGGAYYSALTRSLYISDACILLQYSPQSKEVIRITPFKGWLISGISEIDGRLQIQIYSLADRNREHRNVDCNSERFLFQSGLGNLRNGIFPSACSLSSATQYV